MMASKKNYIFRFIVYSYQVSLHDTTSELLDSDENMSKKASTVSSFYLHFDAD